jgi:hypothetical protein
MSGTTVGADPYSLTTLSVEPSLSLRIGATSAATQLECRRASIFSTAVRACCVASTRAKTLVVWRRAMS